MHSASHVAASAKSGSELAVLTAKSLSATSGEAAQTDSQPCSKPQGNLIPSAILNSKVATGAFSVKISKVWGISKIFKLVHLSKMRAQDLSAHLRDSPLRVS